MPTPLDLLREQQDAARRHWREGLYFLFCIADLEDRLERLLEQVAQEVVKYQELHDQQARLANRLFKRGNKKKALRKIRRRNQFGRKAREARRLCKAIRRRQNELLGLRNQLEAREDYYRSAQRAMQAAGIPLYGDLVAV